MTSAAKPNRRPPLTTLATRLMPTSFSVNSLSSRSRGWRSPSPPRRPCVRAIGPLSEIEPALAGGIGQGLDPAVIEIGAAVEHDPLDPGRLGAFGEQLADRACGAFIGPGLQIRFEAGIEGRGCRERSPGQIVDDLRIDGAERADLGGDLADALAIGAADRDHRRSLAVDPHIRRDRIGNLVTVAELQG